MTGLDTFVFLYSDKIKYMVKSRDHNARRSHSTKMDISSSERVKEFKYLGTALKKLRGLSRRANYTDRAAAAGRRS